MKIRPTELSDNGYVLLDQLGNKELVLFMKTNIKLKSITNARYKKINKKGPC